MKANEIILTNTGDLFVLSMQTKGGTFRTVGLELTDILDRCKINSIDQITEKKMVLESEELIKNDGSMVFAKDIQKLQEWLRGNPLY